MGVNKVVVGDEVKLDLTSDTVTTATLPKGITAHDATGTPITGAAEFAPAKHAAQHASGGADPVTPEAIGAAEKIHTHTTSDVEGLDEILSKPGLNAIFLDLSDANATAEDIAEGKIAYVADAQRIVGTGSAGGLDSSNKPKITYSGKWSGWYIEFYAGKPYWEAIFYTSGTLDILKPYTADLWGVGGGPFDYSGVMSRASAAKVPSVQFAIGQQAVTIGAGATKNTRGSGGDTTVGSVFTAQGGKMNASGSGNMYRFDDNDKINEAGSDGAPNGYAHGEGGWLHWRCGVDSGDGEGYGAGGDYGGYGNALVNAHPGVLVIRIAV